MEAILERLDKIERLLERRVTYRSAKSDVIERLLKTRVTDSGYEGDTLVSSH